MNCPFCKREITQYDATWRDGRAVWLEAFCGHCHADITIDTDASGRDAFDVFEPKGEMVVFEEEETIENCTVHLLRNPKTGEYSVGWHRG